MTNAAPSRPAVFSMSMISLLGIVAAPGCIGGGIGTAINVVGSVVDSRDVKSKQKDLLGKPPSAADEKLGAREDTLTEVGGGRTWGIYPVDGLTNPLNKDRYVVEVTGGTIRSLSRVEKNPDVKFDLPRIALIERKVKGKSPSECEAALEKRPIVTVRSQRTGRMKQLYDGRVIKFFKKPYYCILKFDENNLCEDVDFEKVGASTKDAPFSG